MKKNLAKDITEFKKKLDEQEKGPENYYQVSQTQLSVARYYGGCRINGSHYIYNPTDDTLTREDILKEERK